MIIPQKKTAATHMNLIKPLNSISTKNIVVTPVGCQFTGQETEAEVLDVLQKLKNADKAIPYNLADLYLRHPDIVANAFDPDRDRDGHYTIGSIKVYASILKNWPIEKRRWNLGISFYQAACPLTDDKRQAVMDWVVNEGKSRDELRQVVRLLTNGERPDLPPAKDDIIDDQAQRIYELEQRLAQVENEPYDEDRPTGCDKLVDRIIGLIRQLEDDCPDKVSLIREYLA